MNRREHREAAVIFLYTLEIGGDYEKDNVDGEVFENISDLISHTDEIEDILNKSLVNWKLDRLNLVDKAILKYAVYEMKYLSSPYEIAINEALELTKKYSDIDGKQVPFNNKVLDKAKDLIYG
ncbi:MAG: N utilization substance protein B [Bacillales bacterium]|nr:N utilization substance protein B [Bacillales bacterium]